MPIPETIAHVYQNALTTLFTTTTSISICYWLGDSAQRWRTPDQRYWLGDSAQRWRAPDHRYWSGDSAQRWRVSRNGAPQAGRKKGEMGGGVGRAVAGFFSLAAHLPCSLRRAPPFRCERSEQAAPPLPIPASPTIPQNFAGKILRNPQAYPHKKNGPRGFPGTVLYDVRFATYDARLRKSQIANRKS